MLDLHHKQRRTIAKNELFHGIHETDVPHILSSLNARIEVYEKGEIIVPLNTEVKAGVILEGRAKVSYYDEGLSPMATDVLFKGHTFGQMAACLKDHLSQIELVAMAYTIVCRIDLSPFSCGGKTPLALHHHHIISSNIIKSLAQHAAQMHLRLRIVGQRTVRNRLKVYLNHIAHPVHDTINIPFSMSDLAAFLNSDRSALYKEIRCLKEEGILDWNRREVQLFVRDF